MSADGAVKKAARRTRVAAIVTAAGSSTRMGGLKKEYRPLFRDGEESVTVLGSSVMALADSGLIDLIVIVFPPNGEAEARKAVPPSLLGSDARPRVYFAPGGSNRRQSVHNGLKRIAMLEDADYVFIHDGARPWLDADLIVRLDAAVREANAVIPVLPLVETPKETDGRGFIVRHLKRANVSSAQTPQAFAFRQILDAHERAAETERRDGAEYTDDAEVWGAFVGLVKTIPGSQANRKITFPEDLPAEGGA
jgi:2-C-methyl-D-erythritol 4-phosphate cytidylyltransferase